MATTTPNFGWPVPTSTDLVKDGATAIEALGDGVDASLVDLKGGTTGQVLSKTSGTDLDFTWVTTDDANAIQNSIVDAKGDLIAASAADTPARLGVGANGTTLVADSAEATGLKWAASPNFVGCRVFNSAAQTIATATTTALIFNSETFDTNGFHDNTTNNTRITIPAGYSGKYLIQGSTRYNPNVTGRREITITLNGGGSIATGEFTPSASTFMSTPNFTIASLTAGDYVELKTYQDSGGNLATFGSTDNTFFQVQYLGA